MHGGWYDFEVSRERRRDFLREAEAQRLVRAAGVLRGKRPGSCHRMLRTLDEKVRAYLGRRTPPGKAIPPDEATTVSSTGHELVSAFFEEGVYSLRPSSVIELRREAEAYVIREVDLLTGDDVLYLSTEEPEWAAWIWKQKTHR